MDDTSEYIAVSLPSDEMNIIEMVEMEEMNKNYDPSFMLIIIPVCLSTLCLNLQMLFMLWGKEKTIVNQLMITELIINILFSFLGTFQQSSFYRGIDYELYCYTHLICKYVFLTFNRMVPVAIALYR